MQQVPLDAITSADQARDIAMEWQAWAVEQGDLSWGEVIEWDAYFREIARKFPELKDEFEENGIL